MVNNTVIRFTFHGHLRFDEMKYRHFVLYGLPKRRVDSKHLLMVCWMLADMLNAEEWCGSMHM